VILFIDRMPLHRWLDHTRQPPTQRWTVSLPARLTDSGSLPPQGGVRPQRWVLDTGFTGEAFAWRRHVQDAGLDPDIQQAGTIRARSSLGTSERLPVRSADLWLISNLGVLREHPFLLELDPGVAFRNVPRQPDPEFERPLIGMRALRRAGLKVQIDFAKATLSLWIPGTALRSLFLFLRRTLMRSAPDPMSW
jgi:hypothetical protein